MVADGAASAEDEAAGARAGVAVGADAGTAVAAADATGRGAAGRAAVATGFFFFAIGFFDVVTACRLTLTGLGASRGAALVPCASGRTDTVCG